MKQGKKCPSHVCLQNNKTGKKKKQKQNKTAINLKTILSMVAWQRVRQQLERFSEFQMRIEPTAL